jgi:AcrR family transcriptional regulator
MSASASSTRNAARKPRRPAKRPAAGRRANGGRARSLGEADVVAAAIRLAERDGLDAVAMRPLARELGIEAMSIYSHVTSKQVLLGSMAAHVVSSIAIAPRTVAPRTRLLRLAEGIRDAAREYPNVFPLVVLLPIRIEAAARLPEAALQAFADAGVGDWAAVRAQRSFLSYVRGFVLWEIGGFAAGRRTAPMESIDTRVLAELQALDAARFPETRRLATALVALEPGPSFREGCEAMLDRLLPAHRRKGTR